MSKSGKQRRYKINTGYNGSTLQLIMIYQSHFDNLNPKNSKYCFFLLMALFSCALMIGCTADERRADTILIYGKIVTVDGNFSVAEAVAIKQGKILDVGKNRDILKWKGDSTHIIDLKGHTVIPGLIEGHAHPIQASQSEYFEKIPDLHTISNLLEWISNEARVKRSEEHASELQSL